MSVGFAARPDAEAALPRLGGLLEARSSRIAVGVVGLVAAVGGGLLVAGSDHLVHPVGYGLQLAILIGSTTWIALYWSVQRPGNRIAALLLAYAAGFAAMTLEGASSPVLHSIGLLSEGPMFVLGFWLVFAFPSGRVEGRLERVLLAAVTVATILSISLTSFFKPAVSGGPPLAGCNANCPSNPLMISDNPALARDFGRMESGFEVLIAAAIVAALVYRLVTASAPRRRALLPVYIPALLVTVPFGLFHLVGLGWLSMSFNTFNRIGWFVTVGRVAFSFGFAVAIWQGMLFAGVALKAIVRRLGPESDAAHLRRLVAEVLDDPGLEIAFGFAGTDESLVGTGGERIDVDRLPAGRSVTPLRVDGSTAVSLVHDSALETDPELVEAAGRVILLALDSGRLQDELRSRTAELRRSSSRIVAAGDAERRRLERDLHDGAQQRLMTIKIKLALLRDRLDSPALVSELDEIGDDVTVAVDELRTLAHGIYPPVLRERGLADGLRHYGRSASLAVSVEEQGVGRCAPPVEAAIYFCITEAIQNAAKHAGPRARVAVTLRRVAGTIEFEVADNGHGFDPEATVAGFGLTSMNDRIAAAGGELRIESAAGSGTRIRGAVPDGVESLAGV